MKYWPDKSQNNSMYTIKPQISVYSNLFRFLFFSDSRFAANWRQFKFILD